MTTSFITRFVLAAAIVPGLALGSAARRSDAGEPKDALLGGKLLHRLPYEVYFDPIFFDTNKGPRLAIWVHQSDPTNRFVPGPFDAASGNAKIDSKKKAPVVQQPAVPPFDLYIWDVQAGQQLYRLTPKNAPPAYPDGYRAVEYTPSDKSLLTVEVVPANVRLKLYDLAPRKERTLGTVPAPLANYSPPLVFAPNGDLVIVYSRQCIVYDLNKAKARRVFSLQVPPPAPGTIASYRVPTGPAIAPDGKMLAFVSGHADMEVIEFYDLEKGKPYWQLPTPARPDSRRSVSLAFLPTRGATKLLAVRTVPDGSKGKYVMLAQYLDVKNKSEIARAVLLEGGEFKPGASSAAKAQVDRPPSWGRTYPFFNKDGEPRVVAEGKLFDAATGKALRQTDLLYRYILSRDGKYAVRVIGTSGTDKAKLGLELWSVD